MTEEQKTERRTKRRYAHELYPNADGWNVRPLAVEVPHLYARAMGMEVEGTSWRDDDSAETFRRGSDRILLLLDARRIAFLADALAQGMSGDEAWTWADENARDESGELAWERAEHYGVKPWLIKPYLCGPEPDHHDHFTNQEERYGVVTEVPGPESACPICTEEVPA